MNELADHVIGLATGSVSEDEAVKRQMVERHLGENAVVQIDETVEAAVREKARTMKGILT